MKEIVQANRYSVRVEWGGLTSYVDAKHFDLCWDGGVSVKNGKLKTLSEIVPSSRKAGHFFMGHSLSELKGNTWRSRTNQGLGGVVMEIEGGPDCEIRVDTVQKTIAFTLKELLERKYLRWPVGAKYSGFTICAMMEGEGPFSVDAEVEPGCIDVRLPYSSFLGADHYELFMDNWAAWILPDQSVTTDFTLPRPLHRSSDQQSYLTLELRASLTESKDRAELSSSRYSPVSVMLNGQVIYSAPVLFRTEWSYWVEFIPVQIPLDAIEDGRNHLVVRNDSKKDVLGLMSAQIRESIREDFGVESSPCWVMAGDRCDISLRCLQSHTGVKIKCHGGEYCGQNLTDLDPGLHRLSFTAGAGPNPLEIEINSDSTNRRLTMPVYALSREEPSWKIGGILQNENHDEASEEVEHAIKYCSDTQMGNYLQFRPEPSTVDRGNYGNTTMKQWQGWAELLKERGIYYSFISGHAWQNYNLDNWKSDPKVYEICELMKKIAGEYFFSAHVHEYSRWIYGMMPSVDKANWTMKKACEKYINYVKAIELVKDVPRQTGQAVSLMSYDYEGEIDYIAVETMALNNMHLFAAARGAARIYQKPVWGIHNATYWVKAPDDFTKLTMNWLNFYMTYAAGGNFAISEDGHFRIPHANYQYGFHSEEPRRLQEIIRRFYEYVNTHPRKGRPEVNLALAQGNYSCEIISFPLHFCWLKKQIGHVWGGKGGTENQEKWRYNDPERGVTLIDEWMPYWQDGLHIRHWFTGTPYGQFDVTPAWKASAEQLSSYKSLVFLGWNTMTPEIYARLKEYVTNGGALFMAVPHLSQHEDRAFLEKMEDLNLIKKGNFDDLFGVKINGSGETIDSKEEFVWGDRKYKIKTKAKLADIKINSAKACIKDSKGNVLLTENKLGKGKAYLLTTWAYPGHSGLENVVRDVLSFLGKESRGKVHLDDSSRDVAWYVWKDETGLRNVYLLNTDWTEEGNVKECRLMLAGKEIPVNIREGNITTVSWRDDIAVFPETQEPFIEDIICEEADSYRIIVHGKGKATLFIHALKGQISSIDMEQKPVECIYSKDQTCAEAKISFENMSRLHLVIKLNCP